MEKPTIHQIKQELLERQATQLLEYCLRLARFKQENKELLSFLLFEAEDLENYLQKIKLETAEAFKDVNKSQLYFAKKNLRRILRQLNRHIRYTGSRQAEVELLLHFCLLLIESGIEIRKSPVIGNILKSLIRKIEKSLSSLHGDLQYDYQKQIKKLQPWK